MKKCLPFLIPIFALLFSTNISYAVGITPVKEGTEVTTKQTKKEKRVAKKKLKQEKKQMRKKVRKQLKSALKDAKKAKKAGASEVNTTLLIILAILIPFLAVGLYDGITNRFWISLLLTLLFWLPGVIYALVVILE